MVIMPGMSPSVPSPDEPPSRAVSPLRRDARRPEGTRPEVPDHEILRIIGTGAYGEVWLARSVTGAYRAVKVVWREDFEDERTFVREFEGLLNYEPIARAIPGLVHILHVGRHEGEFPYYFYVMELADDAYTGIHVEPTEYVPRTLRSDMQLYGHHALPLDYVLEVGSQLAQALAGLHAEELTHRDIKPANVVFVNGRAKLADVGLVAHSSKRSFVGTEGYIPPDGPGTPRADVYALAKVLYEMSTGKDRLDFPELPSELPEGTSHRLWMEFNRIICAAAEPCVGRNSIVTAQALANKLDELRQVTPHGKVPRRRRHVGLLSGKRLMVLLLALGFLLSLMAHFLPQEFRERLRRAGAALAGEDVPAVVLSPSARESSPDLSEGAPSSGSLPSGNRPPDSLPPGSLPSGPLSPGGISPSGEEEEEEEEKGQLFIASSPAGASIYTEEGVYLDETPYGPVHMTPGKRVSFILRKEGYADTYESGVIPEHGLLSLGGEMRPYCPPRTGQVWTDALGMPYDPKGETHEARSPVTKQQFEAFLHSEPAASRILWEEVPNSNLIRTTQEGISSFTLWLTRQCEINGLIGRDHSLIASPEASLAAGADMCAYRLSTMLVQKTPITVYSNPAGASVILNGRLLGVTPMQGVRVPLAPYYLEVRLPGYSSVRRSGLSTRDLSLDLVLQPNYSVVFGEEWINSLGMKFQPLSSNLMAAATETRVSDYRAFCHAVGSPAPESPSFEQNEHHPVVFVSRSDAENFARWLTAKEREAGLIEETDCYRLPTDEEWSVMVGLKREKGHSPYDRQRYRSDITGQEFPWGRRWPPLRDTGNFADMAARPYQQMNHIVPNYRDGFPFTAPVGSFEPNMLGLHDMDGNVQEWVSGEYGGPADFTFRHYGVTRGGDFSSFRPNQLHSGSRTPRPVDARCPTVGFRLMLERSNRPL